jgi:hypothetical protein
VKKVIAISLIFLVLFGTIGITVGEHYCMNTLKGISFFSEPAPCCPAFDANEDSCCENEMEYFRLIEDTTVSSDYNHQLVKVPVILIPFLNDFSHIQAIVKLNVSSSFTLPPPLQGSDNLAVLYQVFRL